MNASNENLLKKWCFYLVGVIIRLVNEAHELASFNSIKPTNTLVPSFLVNIIYCAALVVFVRLADICS